MLSSKISYQLRTSITFLLVVTILTASVFNIANTANIEKACHNDYQTGPSDSKSIELWLRSAQFHSFCLSKYGNSNVCSSQCQECYQPCEFNASSISGCESKCVNNSQPCKDGCRAFAFIFGQNVTNNFGINPSMAVKELTGAPKVTKATTDVISLDWTQSIRNGSGSNLYVLALTAESSGINKIIPLYATMGTASDLKLDRLCSVNPRKYEGNLKFLVIPVNKHGWTEVGSQPKTSDTVFMGSTVTDLKVAGSPLYSQGDGGSGNPMVNYNISWSVLSELSSKIKGYEVAWNTGQGNPGTCSIGHGSFTPLQRPKGATTASVVIPILNELMRGCKFDFKVKPLFDCRPSGTSTVMALYEGCWTVSNWRNFPRCVHPMSTTVVPTDQPIADSKVTSVVTGCDAYGTSACNNGTHNTTCAICMNQYWNITVSWSKPALGSPLLAYKCWLGYPWNLGRLVLSRVYDGALYPLTLSKNQTSLTMKVTKNQIYHFKVFPSTVKNPSIELSWASFKSKLEINITKAIERLRRRTPSPTKMTTKPATTIGRKGPSPSASVRISSIPLIMVTITVITTNLAQKMTV